MLTVRKRGRFWYARGTVKAAGKSVYLSECSTGETEEQHALRWARRKETEIENDLREGRPVESRSLTFAMVTARMADSRQIPYRDAAVLLALTEWFGDKVMADITAADWNDFTRTRGRRNKHGQVTRPAKPSTIDRYLYVFRSVFHAAKADGVKMLDLDTPRTSKVRRREQKVRWLTVEEADRLVASYDPRVQPIATLLRYQGFRAMECLQLDRRQIDMRARTIFVGQSKNGYARTVPMHDKSYAAILPLMSEPRDLWTFDDGSDLEPLFMTDKGHPYPDTRGDSAGNPMRTAHTTACRRAGIADFTVHDWRRHWACSLLREGADAWTLMKLGGWSDLKSINPYVQAISGNLDHQAAALGRVA